MDLKYFVFDEIFSLFFILRFSVIDNFLFYINSLSFSHIFYQFSGIIWLQIIPVLFKLLLCLSYVERVLFYDFPGIKNNLSTDSA